MTDTIPALLRAAAARWRERPALRSSVDGATSFADLDRAADRVARALIADEMAAGERIGLWAPNMWEWVAATVGVQRAGGAIVPLNSRLRGGEVADIVRRAKISRLFSIGTFLGRHYPDLLRDEPMPQLRRLIVLRADPHLLAGSETAWDDFIATGDTLPADVLARREAGVTPDTIADIMFTSGTTGSPKGAIFDHRRSLGGGRAWNALSGMTAEDRYCCFGPFSHNASYKAGWIAGLQSGATVHWPEAYDSASILDLIATHRITVMPAPPTVWQEVLNNPDRAAWDMSSLKFLSTGATLVPIELMRRLAAETSVTHITTGYGMTECCGSATHTRPGDSLKRVAYTVGAAIDGTEIRIADTSGRAVAIGEPGEVLIRDDKLLIRYLDQPGASAEALDPDGWLHSGDIGVLDAEGYLKLTDRLKDMFIVGGFNVYPAELEKQMAGIVGLDQCSVIGRNDQRLGEVGHAFIVRAPGSSLTEAEVIAWCKTHLASYKIPRGITFVDALPMNATGKVLKYQLKDLL